MAITTTVCRYCNGEISADQIDPAKPVCPRCGEKMILPEDFTPAPPAVLSPPSVPKQNRKTLLLILGIMGIMASAALAFALLTKQTRRQRDVPNVRLEEHALPNPEDSSLLGFLPSSCNVLGEVKLRQLLKNKAGIALTREPMPEWVAPLVGKVHEWMGMKLGDIDQVAFGVEAKAKLPRVFLIVETMKDLQQKSFQSRLQRLPENVRETPVFRFQAGPMEGFVWLAYKRLAVIVLEAGVATPEALAMIPHSPRLQLAGSDPALLKIFKEKRVEAECLAWCVGNLADAPAFQELAAFFPLANREFGRNVETFSLGLLFRDKVTLSANFFTGDEAKSANVKQWLEGIAAGKEPKMKIADPPPGTPADQQWVTLFWTVPAEQLRALGK